MQLCNKINTTHQKAKGTYNRFIRLATKSLIPTRLSDALDLNPAIQ